MLAKLLLTTSALALIFATPMADYNHTHIFNPRWPPHAKFHTGQTITLSLILGFATLFLTYRPDLLLSCPSSRSPISPASSSPSSPAAVHKAALLRRESLKFAAFTGSIYWLAGLAAWFYPGAEGQDPEFARGGGVPAFPQGWAFGFLGGCALLGGWLGSRRSEEAKMWSGRRKCVS
ncbi:hypothetical protein GE09DRAFT_1228945 [Coniochaeta sp. 2T2.1]|nr:hypothetical protein GE09DRAFT_1228945 [Coniochaeta sp. 2T2.1]